MIWLSAHLPSRLAARTAGTACSGQPHAVTQPLLCRYKKPLVSSIHFLWSSPMAILPTPDVQAVSTTAWIQAGAGAAGGIHTWRAKVPLVSPLQSPLPPLVNSEASKQQFSETGWLSREPVPVPSWSLENRHKPSWEPSWRLHLPSWLSPPATCNDCICFYFLFLVPTFWTSFV